MNNPLVQVDPGLMIWTILTFGVLVTLLTVFAWRPLMQALDARQETIRKSLDDALAVKRELELVQQESAQIIRNAHIEAGSIVSRSRADAEKLGEELKQKARTDADTILKEAHRQIELETGRAIRQIRTEVADLSVMIATKFIQRNLSKEDNDRLIADALKQIDASRS